MKGALPFDPRECEYGEATVAVRAILGEWAEIDWFEPSDVADEQVVELFREHNRLARAADAELFANRIDVRVVTGDRDELARWCRAVRGEDAWDWKYAVLKKLSARHAKARGWTPEQDMGLLGVPPRPGQLFFTLPGVSGDPVLIWGSVHPQLTGLDEAAGFYLSYAHHDVLDCVKWQLAERSSDTAGNPFLPLLRCYAAGAYPFGLGRDRIVLFRFAAAEFARAIALPRDRSQ